MPVDARAFRTAMGQFPTGVTVVTAATDEVLHGMTANAFSSLSLDPPLVLVCVDRAAGMHDFLVEAGGFAVNVLRADQRALSTRFAAPRHPSGTEQFDGVGQRPAPVTASPLLDGAIAWFDCTLHAVHDGGDHSIFVGEVVDLDASDDPPLAWHRGDYVAIGSRVDA